jgi:uncharacterized protein YhdP
MTLPEVDQRAPKRRWLKITGIVALSAIVLVSATIVAANYYLSRNSQEVLRRLSEQTGLEIKVGKFVVDWRLHRPQIRLEEVQIRSGSTNMTAEHLRMELRVRESLIRRDLRLREVEVKGLKLDLPLIVDQPFADSSKKSVAVSDLIATWQRFSQVIDVLLLSDAAIGMNTSAGQRLDLKLASLRLAGDQHSGDIALTIAVNQTGNLQLKGDWKVNSSQEFSLSSRLQGTEFPAPLFHKDIKDFEKVKTSLTNSLCKDYGTVPCIRLRQFNSALNVAASEQRLAIEMQELNAATTEMSVEGKIAIAAENDAVDFNIDLRRSRGSLQAVLSVLDSAWMGTETYQWLIDAIPGAIASNGSVRIEGSTRQKGFKEFDIGFNASAPSLVFAAGWPAIVDLGAVIKIGADQLDVKIESGRYGELPMQNASFSIPSFAKDPMIAHVQATTSGQLAEVFANLDASPIGKEITEVRSYLDPQSKASITADVELDLNLSQFDEQGISYKVGLSSSAARLSLLDGIIAFDDSDLALMISGQASEKRQRLNLKGSLKGRSAGQWVLAERPHIKFDIDPNRPWRALRAAIGMDAKVKLPKSSGLSFKLPKISGDVRLTRKSGHQHVSAKFGRLIIPDLNPKASGASDPKTSKKDTVKSQSKLDPATMPSFDIEIGQLEYNDLELGHVEIGARHNQTGLFEITGGIKAPRVSLELDDGEWLRSGEGSTSFFRGRLAMNDTGAVLSKLRMFDGLTSGSSTHDFDLKWPGAPWDFSAADSKGFILSKMTGGELISVDSFFIKLIDILTLKSFKFYEKGSKIERVDAKLRLDSGKLIMDLIDLDLSSTNLKFRGEADLVKETLATDVGMEVKIGEAVGTAAAVVTIGPIGIALGYLSSNTKLKLPSLDVLNQLTAFSYRLEGPWEDPELKSFRPKPFGI